MLPAGWEVLVAAASIHVLVLGGGPGARAVVQPLPQRGDGADVINDRARPEDVDWSQHQITSPDQHHEHNVERVRRRTGGEGGMDAWACRVQ